MAKCNPSSFNPVISLMHCGNYDAFVAGYIEAQSTAYYDHATGMLVASVGSNVQSGTQWCSVGPSCFDVPSTCTVIACPTAEAGRRSR
jgi:hypothetical protein